MKKQQEAPRLYWTIGSFRNHSKGARYKYWGVIWDAGGSEVWVGPLHDTKQGAQDETAQKMRELMK